MSKRGRLGFVGSIGRLGSFAGAVVVLAVGVLAAPPQPADSGAFSDAQAAGGQRAFAQACAGCHGPTLRGGELAPELAGVGFMSLWGERTTRQLFDYIKRDMPPGQGGSSSGYSNRNSRIVATKLCFCIAVRICISGS